MKNTRESVTKSLMSLIAALFVAMSLSCSVSMDANLETKSVAPAGSGVTQTATGIYKGRLTGVNWFGFETSSYVFHGLWTRDYKSMLKQIQDLGFNCIRIPYCDAMIGKSPNGIQINADGVDPYTKIKGMNLDLAGLTSLQVLDKVMQECDRIGLKVILDNHARAADAYMVETLWYTAAYPESTWINNWVMIANRYKNNPSFIGADLDNEPHGNMMQGSKPPATWGYDEPGQGVTDWKAAAEKCGKAILAVNPNLLIIVEGTEEYKRQTYWWGGNLKGVKDAPITGIPAENLVYSPHEYGPEVYPQAWFTASTFPSNMYQIWDDNFWFIYKQGIAPLFFGEFGIKEDSAANPSSVSYIWFTSFMKYCGKNSSWTFWCMNPNSGDTGGILKDDWVSVNTAKYGLLKPYLAMFDGGQSSSTTTSKSSLSSSSSSSSVFSAVSSSSSSSTPNITYTAVPAKIEAENYGAMSGIQTEACGEGTLNVGWVDTGDWLDYGINATSAGDYTIELRVASIAGSGAIDILIDNSKKMTLSVPNTGGWQTYTTVSGTINLSGGNHVLRLYASGSPWNINWINITKTGASSSSSSSSVTSSSSSSSSVSSRISSSSSSSSSSTGGVYTTITAPFSFDGAGTYRWKIAVVPNYINSWNLSALSINGVSFLNLYTSASQLPAKQDGYYYIDYTGPYNWSHIEIK